MVTEAAKSKAGVEGLFHLRVQMGGKDISIEPQAIDELTITSDLNSFLPLIRLKVFDPDGILTHLIPFDQIRKISLDLGKGDDVLEQHNSYEFDVYRRFPTVNNMYDVEGLLSVPNLFDKQYCRGFDGYISSMLESIAEDDLELDTSEISYSLNYSKDLVQPNCTNAQFLNFLKDNIIGEHGEAGFYVFVKNSKLPRAKGYTSLVFKCIDEFFRAKPKCYFMIGGEEVLKDNKGNKVYYYPVYSYKIVDHYKIAGVRGLRKRLCSYFDYDNSRFVMYSKDLDNYLSLTDHFLIAKDDPNTSLSVSAGTSNDFALNFEGMVLNSYYRGVTGLSKMWITVQGFESLVPGDIVKVRFAHPAIPDERMSLQYQGFWMVERVVHIIGMVYMCRILLTRNGVDTLEDTSLIRATRRKKEA